MFVDYIGFDFLERYFGVICKFAVEVLVVPLEIVYALQEQMSL